MVEITPLDPRHQLALGAVVTGADLRQDGGMCRAAWAAIEAAFVQYGLLIIPGQHGMTSRVR